MLTSLPIETPRIHIVMLSDGITHNEFYCSTYEVKMFIKIFLTEQTRMLCISFFRADQKLKLYVYIFVFSIA